MSFIMGPFGNTELYANWGWGFHSNDARGAVQTRDPKSGEAVSPADPIVRAKGAEIGLRTVATGTLQTTLNSRASNRLSLRHRFSVDVFKLANAKVSDIDYFYASRLPGEPEEGIEDVHTDPLEPFTVRASLAVSF